MKRRSYVSAPTCSVLESIVHGTGTALTAHTVRVLREWRLLAPRKLRLNANGKATLRACRRRYT